MAEPHSAAVGVGVAVGAGIGLAGTVFGAQVDCLILGLLASILVSFSWPAIDDRRKAASAVAFSALVSGYIAPPVAMWLASQIDALVYGDQLQLATALVLGAATPTIAPVMFGRVASVLGGQR